MKKLLLFILTAVFSFSTELSQANEVFQEDSIIVSFAGKKNNETASQNELLKNPVLEAEFSKQVLEVLQFDIATVVDGFEKAISSKSGNVTEMQLNLLKSLKAGNIIYIENIKVRGPNDGTIRDIAPIIIKIR